MPDGNIGGVVPSALASTETLLQPHVERLPAAVVYLQTFPVEIADVFPKPTSGLKTDVLNRGLRFSLLRCLLNPLKDISLRRFFRAHRIRVVLAEYGLTGTGTLKLCEELKIPLVVHFHGYDAYSNEVLNVYGERYRRMFRYAAAIIGVSKHRVGQLLSFGAPRD